MAGPYSIDDIQVLTGVEPLRRRPGMYVGDVAREGLDNLLWGLVDLELDPRKPCGARALAIEIDGDSTVTIRDDGDGLSVDLVDGQPALETLFTTMHGRMLGIPVHPIASALSETLTVTTTRDGKRWSQAYARGIAVTEVVSLGQSSERGTTIRFRPDATIFPSITFDLARIAERLRAIAWLNPHFAISWQGERLDNAGGIACWIGRICEEPIEQRIHGTWAGDSVDVDLALAWRGSGDPIVRAFVCNYETGQGSHVAALWTGLAALASRALEARVDPSRARERLGAGLVGIVHVRMVHPAFTDQRRTTLRSSEAGAAVEHGLAKIELTASLRRFLLARLL